VTIPVVVLCDLFDQLEIVGRLPQLRDSRVGESKLHDPVTTIVSPLGSIPRKTSSCVPVIVNRQITVAPP